MHMQKLSLLIFSRDEAKKVISLAKEMYRIVDDVVVIDSSERKNFARLQAEVSSKKLAKVKLFHTIALGYAEPLRTYGISKCKNKWILLLDTDEQPSKELKKNIKKIIDTADFDVLLIKRHEHVIGSSKKRGFFTWQVRLFKKNSLEYLGLIHETPRIYGKIKKLNPELGHINHFSKPIREYEEMNLFETRGMPFLILRDLFVDINTGKIKSVADARAMISRHVSTNNERSKETMAIGRIIRKQGLIKYLKLEEEKTIKRLNKKYLNKKQGITLLITLLKNRYKETNTE